MVDHVWAIAGPPFELFPERTPWWSFEDYAVVVTAVRLVDARNVLEFGPGSSTLAILEGGADRVVSCEDDPAFADSARKDFARFGRIGQRVEVVEYQWSDPLELTFDGIAFELALIDGPRSKQKRPAVLRYALDRCGHVLIPTEDASAAPYLKPIIEAECAARRRPVEFIPSGKPSGSMALIGPGLV